MMPLRATQPRKPSHAVAALHETYWPFAPLILKIAVKKFGIPAADAETLVYEIFTTYLTAWNRIEPSEGYFIGSMCNAAHSYLHGDRAPRESFCGQVPCVAIPTEEIRLEVERERLIRALRWHLRNRLRSLKQARACILQGLDRTPPDGV